MLDISKQYTLADILLAALPEMWKDVPTYEGLYMVSTYGRVYKYPLASFTPTGLPCIKKEKLMKSSPNQDGYYQLELRKNGKDKSWCVHKLVAFTFLENPLNKPQANHKDGNKSNNHLWNLQWATNAENIQHAYDIGLEKPRYGKDHHRSKPVINTITGQSYESLSEAAKANGMDFRTLSDKLLGNSKNETGLKYL